MIKKKGFTLIELIIYVGILGVVSLIIVNFFGVFGRTRAQNEARTEVEDNLRLAIEKISRDVRIASAISLPAAGGQSSTLGITIGGVSTTYQISGQGILQRVSGGTVLDITSNKVVVANNSDNFVRTDNSGGNIRSITLQVNLLISYASQGRPDFIYSNTGKTAITIR
ncbi:MAG: prepilin-type N-terminal cleavage/methylation domain-containing protein [Parcubacteria group bacterium]|nr:prepilin-type N-terminal cleavage/methylation domain-containing protein [Parcubacteria group bacterium]